MELFFQDLLYGFRGILSRKGLSLAVIFTLGLAIGVDTTVFSLARTVLFALLPFEDPDSLLVLWSHNPGMSRTREPSSLPDFLDLKRELGSFRGLAAWSPEGGSSARARVKLPCCAGGAGRCLHLWLCCLWER